MRVIQVEHVNGQKPSSLIRAGNHPQTLMRETTKNLSAERGNSMHSGRTILQIQCCSSAVLFYRYRRRWKRHNDTRDSQQHSARKIVLHMVHMALEPSFLASSASHHIFLMRKHWATDSVPRYPALGFPTCYRISFLPPIVRFQHVGFLAGISSAPHLLAENARHIAGVLSLVLVNDREISASD